MRCSLNKVPLQHKVQDSISRLPDCAGEASDALVIKGDAPNLLRLPEAECPAIGIRPPRSRSSKSWDNKPHHLVHWREFLVRTSITKISVVTETHRSSVPIKLPNGTRMGMLTNASGGWLISFGLLG